MMLQYKRLKLARKFDIVEPLLWDTSIQGTPPFRGHKIWSRKNVHIIFVSVTSVVGAPLFRGKGNFSWVSPYYSKRD